MNHNTSIDPDLCQTEDDILAFYDFRETACNFYWICFSLSVEGMLMKDFPCIIIQRNLVTEVCYSKSSLDI